MYIKNPLGEPDTIILTFMFVFNDIVKSIFVH